MIRLRQSCWHHCHAALALLVLCLPIINPPVFGFPLEDEAKPSAAAKPEPVESTTGPITAIVGATVVTMGPAGTLENATVLIQDQEILNVGVTVEIPKDATVIAAKGMTLTPGLIDCRSSLWLASDSINASASDGSLNAIDGIDPFSDSWQEVASQGITTVCVGPKGSLGGQSVILRVAPSTSTAKLVVKESASMQASLGLSGSTGNSKDRYAQYESLKKTLDAAKAYQDSWKKYDEAIKKAEKEEAAKSKASKKAASEKPKVASKSDDKPAPKAAEKAPKDKPEEKKPEPPKKPKRDLIKEVLVRVLDKELPLRIEAHRADDLANAMKLAKDFDLIVTFEGVSDVGRTWKSLTDQHPALVVGPFCDFEPTASYASNQADRYAPLRDYDGLVAIATFSKDSRASRLLRFHAAAAVAGGLTQEKTLRAITIDAARVLGIDSETGSIEKGKKADLVIVNRTPVDPAAAVMLTMSHGEIVYRDDQVKRTTESQLVDVPSIDRLPDSFALTSDRILYPSGKLAPGVILVRNGKIAAVRRAKSKTGDLQVIDVGEAVVTPGLVVGHFSEAGSKTTDAVSAHVNAVDSLSPTNSTLKDLNQGGFTTVMYAPDSESVVAGQIGCVRIESDQQVLMNNDTHVLPASKFVLSDASRSTNRYPASLSGQIALLKQYLSHAKTSDSLYLPVAARKFLETQQASVITSLKNAATVAVVEAATSPEIEAAANLAKLFGLKMLVLHPNDPATSIDKLKDLKAGMIARTTRISDHGWYARDLVSASQAGLKLCLSGNDATRIRQSLAVLVGAGMNPEAALRALTSDAADNYGLKTIGKLIKGNAADIVIWDDSPLNLAARPIHVIVDGRLTKDVK